MIFSENRCTLFRIMLSFHRRIGHRLSCRRIMLKHGVQLGCELLDRERLAQKIDTGGRERRR